MFHRFSKAGTKFDCSLERTPTEFATVAKDYADLPMRSEQVWEDPDKSLSNVLALVGLRVEPMEGKGTQIITAELDQRAALGKLASQSCSTDPLAIFERLKNSDVRMTAHASPGRGLARGKQDENALLAEQSSRFAEAVKEAVKEDEAERQAAKSEEVERSSAEKAAAEKAAAEKAAAEKAAAEKAAAEMAAAEKAAAEKAAAVTEAADATEAAATQRELVAASDQDQYLFWPSYVRRGSAYIRSAAIAP